MRPDIRLQNSEADTWFLSEKIRKMEKINIFNSKDKKQFLKELNTQYGIEELPDYVYFTKEDKEKVYISNKEIFNFDLEEIKTRTIGLYVGTKMKDGFRFSIEGSQIFGKLAKKNIFEIGEAVRNVWITGVDIECFDERFQNQYVIVKCNDDFFASGKVKNNLLINYISKTRKVKNVFEN
jgi:NOL1/NOP2/fmu family ribosome biogenesis protein